MKTIKYILFLFLFITISCKTLNVTKESNKELETIPENTEPFYYNECDTYDTDKDGVPDEYDKCPDIKGTSFNSGCPEIESSYISQDSVVNSVREIENPKSTKNDDRVKKKVIKTIKKEVVIQDPQYTDGLIAYKVPKDMVVGSSYLVKIRITKENNKTMLIVGDRKIPIADDDNSIVSVESINVSPIMSANLIVAKNSFRIDTLSTEYQNISKRGYTEWAWNIIPLKGGNNLLKLNVKIRVKEDGESYYKDIVVFDKKIKIKSNIKFSIITWISEHWEWFFGVILIPLIKWLYDEWKKRKEENKKKV
jgi:hypothetical protein